MTSNTVPAILDAVLDPLAAVQTQVEAALFLAQQYKLPAPFIHTIQGAIQHLEQAGEVLNEICITLDPDRRKPKP